MTASELFTSLKRQVECGEFIEIDDEQYFDGYRPTSADTVLRILVERAIIARMVCAGFDDEDQAELQAMADDALLIAMGVKEA